MNEDSFKEMDADLKARFNVFELAVGKPLVLDDSDGECYITKGELVAGAMKHVLHLRFVAAFCCLRSSLSARWK